MCNHSIQQCHKLIPLAIATPKNPPHKNVKASSFSNAKPPKPNLRARFPPNTPPHHPIAHIRMTLGNKRENRLGRRWTSLHLAKRSLFEEKLFGLLFFN
ncbi:MAG TPA: hypothetical protein VE944_02515 [Nostoc sp.]|uniref:hypothetical protein n=1 Tax=Nostoc sp. TaxID=1180 RepID=UPI002D694C4D|nr:hypothetical protein [Nostoc sp.]HYX13239.1 hypothetical protein [Nostoc sp.]